MRRGDDAAAWRINDAVLAARDPATRDDPALPYHQRWVWDGRPPDGQHVLVRCYHGLGDTLQFARYWRPLRRRAASVTVEVQPELLPALAGVPGPDRLIPFDPAAPAPSSACDVESMELSHVLRLPAQTCPPPYLQVQPAALPASAIGLCWQAGDWDAARSVPLALAADAFSGLPVVALRPGPVPAALGALNPQGCGDDVSGTAALIAGLNLVVTVDTMVAHLTGALNRPCWLLLRHDADWRWPTDRAHSPWYPSMRLFRQPAPGDWVTVMARVATALAAMAPG